MEAATMSFDCSKCGACCRLVRFMDPTWPTRADGSCIHLNADNTCAVYETRPAVCRVDESRPAGMTVAEWHALNAAVCKQLKGNSDE